MLGLPGGGASSLSCTGFGFPPAALAGKLEQFWGGMGRLALGAALDSPAGTQPLPL